MRPLRDFSAKDWFRLQPLIHGGKQLRNDLVLNLFLKKRSDTLEKFLQENICLRGKNILQIIAFEQPEVLNFSARMAARHLTDATLLVFDNSRRPEMRARNEQVCRDNGIAYLALPPNPARHPNRSHGMAMTWVWRNVVKVIQPSIAGFIDHDLIQLERVSLAETLHGQPFYGLPNAGKWGWSLWAGYCFFDFARVNALPLNFLNDFSCDLDTGGRNWDHLYKNHKAERLGFAHWEMFEVKDASTGVLRPLEIIDGKWLHIAGVSYREFYRENAGFYAMVGKAIEQGANWPQLQSILGPNNVQRLSADDVVKKKRRRWRTIPFEKGAGITSGDNKNGRLA
jgi:hypothetical protein